MSTVMCIVCLQAMVHAIVDEMEDWQDEGVQTLFFGVTTKAAQGFIYLGWSKPIPLRFHIKLREDEDILDYFTFPSTHSLPIPPA